ncbi:MAG: hypothetical protein KDA47_17760 [Planctomycetales bacterium]|nr:hypothetical protein [Planctomycetales bacterium]
MDTIELRPQPHPDPSLGRAFHQVEPRNNGVPLLDLVAAAEQAPTQTEFDERAAAGEDPDGLRIEPGRYMYPTIGQVKQNGELPFGSAQRYFVLESNDDDFDATVLLGCDCGEPGCWMLLMDCHTAGDTITSTQIASPRQKRIGHG